MMAVNAVTGEPIAGVHVTIMVRLPDVGLSSAYGAMSDTAGRFSVSAMAPGTYFPRPERAGFFFARAKDGPPIPVVDLKPGQRLDNYRLEMAPHAVISGRVTDEAGGPVRGLSIRAEPVPPDSVSLSFLRAGFGTTNDRGEYRMSVPPGKYHIRAEVVAFPSDEPEEIRTDGSIPAVYPATWYPKASAAATAAVVESRPELETAGIDIQLGYPVQLKIDGIVTGIPAGRSAFVNVNAMVRHGNSEDDIAVAADGSFSLGRLEQGTYYLYAWTTEQNHLQSAVVELDLKDKGVPHLVLALRPAATFSGTLEMEAGAGEAAGHRVRVEPLTGSFNFGQGFMGDVHSGAVNREGGFEIAGVFPERYRVAVRPLPEDGYVKTVRLDGTVVPGGILDLRNAGGSKLTVTVGNRAARISGAVEGKSGRVIHGTGRVLLVPEGAETMDELWHDATIASDGTYSFSHIPPGKYKLFAVELFGGSPIGERLAGAEIIEIKEGDRIVRDLRVDDGRK